MRRRPRRSGDRTYMRALERFRLAGFHGPCSSRLRRSPHARQKRVGRNGEYTRCLGRGQLDISQRSVGIEPCLGHIDRVVRAVLIAPRATLASRLVRKRVGQFQASWRSNSSPINDGRPYADWLLEPERPLTGAGASKSTIAGRLRVVMLATHVTYRGRAELPSLKQAAPSPS